MYASSSKLDVHKSSVVADLQSSVVFEVCFFMLLVFLLQCNSKA